MSAAAAALRRLGQEGPRLARGIHNGRPALGGHDGPHYLHAEHMYEPWNIAHKKLKWGVAITLFVSIGFGLPFYAVHWQQKKAAG
ncbi:hypothetical protein WJX81_003937 [Elliptochloris bilobata]|uniref:Cytochrome c oxidase polypeptide VIIc n=1 Tax=Elliptochloris bilobata TaxID=381761 RepID=A0AAW1S7N9_9CHLO